MITRACDVLFDGILVGYLAYIDNSGFATFEYTKEWQSAGFSLSPIHLPLTNQTFTFPTLNFETFKGLPAVFADSLPDDFGNSLINAWLQGAVRINHNF